VKTMTADKTARAAGKKNPFRVLVVDDSAVIRGFVSRWLEEDDDISVVATASNGQMALNSLRSCNAEVVVLDIEMPVMDGLTALPKMIAEVPDIKIMMSSTLTHRNADISMRALQMGAADYVPKPDTNREVNANENFRRDLVAKVKALAATLRRERGETFPTLEAADEAVPFREAFKQKKKVDLFPNIEKTDEIRLVAPSSHRPEIMVVGASTGGPQAVCKFLADAKHFLTVPVLVTQHMPPTFTTIFAEHIAKATGRTSKEGVSGERLEAGRIYVAPGDRHMVVVQQGGVPCISINDDPPENFCRPAVDPLFRSVAGIYGNKTLAVVLTGMGHDGLKGGREILSAGGTILAQDESSSVVWGMPGSVAVAGLCSAILSLDDIGPTAGRFIMGGKL
jgi:two-component system, chemotaxis family, protein-glutamate methylesterase/glutaminase